MAGSIPFSRFHALSFLHSSPSSSPLHSKTLFTSLPTFSSPSTSHLFSKSPSLRSPKPRPRVFAVAALGKLSEAELVSIPSGSEELQAQIPAESGVYGVYNKDGDLQFIGISRNVAASIASHRKSVPDLCCSVKVGLVDGSPPDRTVLTDAWKTWIEEHLAANGKIPPGNERGNNTWFQQPQRKSDLRLTPGRHVQLTVPLEELIDRLVKEKEIVAFIKGSRSAPQCGFSQRVVGILESHGIDFESVDVLDDEYNSGLRDTLKNYSNWPTFPQVFVRGELLGGCDIISSMAEKGELASMFKK